MKRGRSTATDIELGKRLRAYRRAAGLNQTKLGAAVGLTFQQIQKYEKGTNRISAGTLFELAHALGIDVSQFFEGLKATSRKVRPKKKAPGQPPTPRSES